MTSLPDDWNDIWTTINPQQLATNNAALNLDTISDIQPLDDQFGADPKKTAPDALYGVLFGQSQPSEVEITVAGGDPQNVPPIQTYALLDAAKITHLPEMLGASDLEHRCLFKGAAYEELKDVAPWLVRLEEGNDFTRNLFTAGSAPWHLWEHEAGVYIRSRASLEELWKHFRKFTKVRDLDDKWFYFRFWEPETTSWYLTIQSKSNIAQDRFFRLAYQVITINSETCTVFSYPEEIRAQKILPLNLLTPDCRAALRTSHLWAISRRILSRLRETFPDHLTAIDGTELSEITTRCLARMTQYGFRSERNLEHMVAWELFYGPRLEGRDVTDALRHICESKGPEFEKFTRYRKRMKNIELDPKQLRVD